MCGTGQREKFSDNETGTAFLIRKKQKIKGERR